MVFLLTFTSLAVTLRTSTFLALMFLEEEYSTLITQPDKPLSTLPHPLLRRAIFFGVNLDGGDFFQAFALQNNVDALKKAVKQERPNDLMKFDAAKLIVTNKMDEPPTWLDIVANKLDPKEELRPGQEYSVHTPKE